MRARGRLLSWISLSGASRHSAQRRGGVLVLAAGMMVLIFALTAFTVDFGRIALTRAQLQNAADGAAIAGAQALIGSPGEARKAAVNVGEAHRAAARDLKLVPGADVELGTWDATAARFTPMSGTGESAADAVRVTCRLSAGRGTSLGLFFAPLIGVDQTDVQASAVAQLDVRRCGRIVGLNWVTLDNGKVDSYNSELGPYSSQTPGRNGHVCSNGPITLAANAAVYGDAHPGRGSVVNRPDLVTGSTTPRTSTLDVPPIDPSDAKGSNNNGALPNSVFKSSDGSFTLDGSRTYDMPPGKYYFKGSFSIAGTAQLNITGPTEIYVAGPVSITGRGIANTGRPVNLKLYTMGTTARLAGNAQLSAVVYGPTTDITIAGNGGLFGAVVGKTLALEGNPTNIHYDESLDPIVPEFARGKLVQ